MRDVHWIPVLLFLTLTCPSRTAQAVLIVIDDFSAGTGVVNVGPEENTSKTATISGLDPANTIGGSRQLFASGDAPFIDSLLSVQFFDDNGTIKGEIFSFNGFGTAGIRWGTEMPLALPSLLSGTFDLNIDTSAATMSFEPSTRVALGIVSNQGEADEVSMSVEKLLGEGTDLDLSWDLAEFGAIDFSNVDSIELGFARDFQITQPALLTFNGVAVPEPRPVLLLSIPFVFLVLSRKHRQGRM